MVCLFAYAQATERWTEWSFRTVSEHQALSKLAEGEAVKIVRWNKGVAQVVGYRSTRPERLERSSPCTLTFGTMKAVANSVGAAKNVQLSRGERMQIEKFKVWPLIGDTKAVAVRPRISERERRVAETLLGAVPTRKAHALGPLTRLGIAQSSGRTERMRMFEELRREGFGELVLPRPETRGLWAAA
jgi:hypothetical protein